MIHKTKIHSKPNLDTAIVNFTILAAIFKILTPLKLEDFLQLSKNVASRPQGAQKKVWCFCHPCNDQPANRLHY